VEVINSLTQKKQVYTAKVIFLNASTIASTSILLNSHSDFSPNGLGNSSGQLGHNLMDHFVRAGAQGEFDGNLDKYYKGRTPANIYVPRFRNIDEKSKQDSFIRGYAFQGKGYRKGWQEQMKNGGFGQKFKDNLLKPGAWVMSIGGWGETLPYYSNKISLSETKKDKWGIPLLEVDMSYHKNEHNMREDILKTSKEMLKKAGFKNIKSFNYERPPGSAVHEMGTARMGLDPKTSVLNAHNQLHDVPNVFITDGSCMTSSATQNPSLTYMALTARACAHAIKLIKSGSL
jgi:choline dehydrogenase-like flavoprotein